MLIYSENETLFDPRSHHHCNLHIMIGERESAIRYLKRKYKVNFLPIHRGTFFMLEKDGKSLFFIWMEKFDWSIPYQSLMAHELIHFTFSAFEKAGINVQESKQEPLAYYYDYIFEKIWYTLKPKK